MTYQCHYLRGFDENGDWCMIERTLDKKGNVISDRKMSENASKRQKPIGEEQDREGG